MEERGMGGRGNKGERDLVIMQLQGASIDDKSGGRMFGGEGRDGKQAVDDAQRCLVNKLPANINLISTLSLIFIINNTILNDDGNIGSTHPLEAYSSRMSFDVSIVNL